MRPDWTWKASFRELAHRIDGGVDVRLLWSARENRLAVTVFDEHAGELVVLDAESDEALDVFYHPYAPQHRGRYAEAQKALRHNPGSSANQRRGRRTQLRPVKWSWRYA